MTIDFKVKPLLLFVVIAICAANSAFAQTTFAADELDAAVRETSDYLNKQLPKGNKLAILNVQSEFPALSEYIIDELIANTVNDRIFSVVDRQQLNTIRAELNFHMSGEVSDESAQGIGHMLGAQVIISGAVSRIGSLYRLRVRALSVESAQIVGQFNRNIPNGPTVSALVQSQATGYGSGAYTNPQGAATAVNGAGDEETSAEQAVYQIGDRGPAGGWVFYDKKVLSNGWRYLEVVPAEMEWSNIQWGTFNSSDLSGLSTALGSGKRNTEIIVTALRSKGQTDRAAQLCDMLVFGGYDDWFLPSRDELTFVYTNMKQGGLGNFSGNWYWFSSLANGYQGQRGRGGCLRFSDGAAGYDGGNEALSVRAIRQF